MTTYKRDPTGEYEQQFITKYLQLDENLLIQVLKIILEESEGSQCRNNADNLQCIRDATEINKYTKISQKSTGFHGFSHVPALVVLQTEYSVNLGQYCTC